MSFPVDLHERIVYASFAVAALPAVSVAFAYAVSSPRCHSCHCPIRFLEFSREVLKRRGGTPICRRCRQQFRSQHQIQVKHG